MCPTIRGWRCVYVCVFTRTHTQSSIYSFQVLLRFDYKVTWSSAVEQKLQSDGHVL